LTTDAEVKAQRAREPITLLDGDGFNHLLQEHYEDLDPEHKAGIPLRNWVPTQ